MANHGCTKTNDISFDVFAWFRHLVCNSWDDMPTLVRVPELHGDDVSGILFQDGSDEFARSLYVVLQLFKCS